MSIFRKFLNSLPQIKFDLLKELLSDKNTTQMPESFIHLILDLQILASVNSEVSFEESKNELLFYSMLLLTGCLFNKSTESAETEDNMRLNGNNQNDLKLDEQFKSILIEEKLKIKRINWFKYLLLIENKTNLAKKSSFKKEACAWLFRICLLEQNQNQLLGIEDCPLLEIFLIELLSLLTVSINFKLDTEHVSICCKDYFLLTTNLISNLEQSSDKLDMNDLMSFIERELKQRDFYEMPNANGNINEDDVLIGLFNLAIAILRQELKHSLDSSKLTISKQSSRFIDELYDYLFKLNIYNGSNHLKQKKIQLPKCRSSQSRALCFELLIELCRSNLDNYGYLYNKLIGLHKTPQNVF